MTNAIIDPLAIIELTNLKAAGKLEELAEHPALNMRPEWMRELTQHKHDLVRKALARNPAIPSRTANPQAWQTTERVTTMPTL